MPQTRAAYMRTYIMARRKVRRARLIELLGGRCVRCGSTDELEFDHICRTCHVAKGIEDRPEPAHSYYRYWYYGCRCATCKAANARKSARQRERKLMGKVGMIPFPTIPTAAKPLVKLPRRDSNTEPAG